MDKTVIYFWCKRCKLDHELIAHQRQHNSFMGLCWAAKCPKCGKVLYRAVSNPRVDPYYRTAKRAKVERRKFADDLLQPGDPRFDLLYPQHKKKREEQLEKLEKEKWQQKRR